MQPLRKPCRAQGGRLCPVRIPQRLGCETRRTGMVQTEALNMQDAAMMSHSQTRGQEHIWGHRDREILHFQSRMSPPFLRSFEHDLALRFRVPSALPYLSFKGGRRRRLPVVHKPVTGLHGASLTMLVGLPQQE